MPMFGWYPWKVILWWPGPKGNTLGLMALPPSGWGNPPRPFTTDHCQPFDWSPGARSKKSSLTPSADTMNDRFVESRDLTLHQTTQLLKKGMSRSKVTSPNQSLVVTTNWPPAAFGSPKVAMPESKTPDSASKGR